MIASNSLATKLKAGDFQTKSGCKWNSFAAFLQAMRSEVASSGAVDYAVASGLPKKNTADVFMKTVFTREFREHILPFK